MIVGGITYPAASLIISGEPVNVPPIPGSSGAEVAVDLGTRRDMFQTTITENMTVRFPKNAWSGANWRHAFIGTGASYTVSHDLTTFMVGAEPPEVNSGAGVYNLIEYTVVSVNPPVADARVLRSGSTAVGSPRQFSIYPPVNGKSVWFLDFDGPCEITQPGEYDITPIGAYMQANVKAWGPGGSTGAVVNANINWSMTDPGVGTDTTFDDMIAGKGGRSLSMRAAGGSDAFGTGGIAGVASGGDINTNGAAGDNAGDNGFSGDVWLAGGAAAPDGGAYTGRAYVSTFPNFRANGIDGNPPGGGARGSGLSRNNGGGNYDQIGSGGGGSGAKVEADYGPGEREWLQGVTKRLVIGDSGTPGTSQDNNVGNIAQGGKGAPGRFIIT